MKLNYLSRLKTALLSNLKGLKTLTLLEVLSLEGLSLMKLQAYEIGIGFGQKYYVLRLLTMKALLYLFQHRKDITISLISTKKGNGVGKGIVAIINPGALPVSIIHIFKRRK